MFGWMHVAREEQPMLPRRLLLVTFLVLTASLAHAQDRPKNVVSNPSLEEPMTATGLPDGWSPFDEPANSYKVSVVTGGHTGDKSLMVEGNGRWGGVATTRIPVGAGMRYLARGWVKIEGDPEATASIQVSFSGRNGDYLGAVWMGNVTPADTGWQCISVPAHAADFPEAASVWAGVSVNGKAKAWFDDLELVEVDGPEAGGNLLLNGDMEEVVDGRPVYWVMFTEPGAVATLAASDDAPREGKHCLCLKGQAPYISATGERYRIEPGKRFRLTGFLRAVSGDALLQFDYIDKDGKYLGNTESRHVTGSKWEEQSVAVDFAAFPTATHFAASLAVGAGTLEACFDDLRLVEE
jgi:hypothetical protein